MPENEFLKASPDEMLSAEQKETQVAETKNDYGFSRESPRDLQESYFIEVPIEERKKLIGELWEQVRDLDDNDTRKILFFRRFLPNKTINLNEDFEYLRLDHEKFNELEKVKPYRPTIILPPGVKLGIVIGYHHLEKPWGRLFKDMFLDQTTFDPEKVQFIEINNSAVPTGEYSPSSNEEIHKDLEENKITHLIDIHEEISDLNHYMNHIGFSEEDIIRQLKFDQGRKCKNEFTLDPFVPLWCIEQYYEGYIYPQLQYAVNEQIRDIELLIENLAKTTEN